MIYLHQIGALHEARYNPNFNTLGQVVAHDGPMSFDGIYESVYNNQAGLKGKDVTFFVSGAFVGGDNSFDVKNGQPLSRFCTLGQIEEMAETYGAKIGYHGWAHQRCDELTGDDLVREMRPPSWLMRSPYYNNEFAWPHGYFNELAKETAQKIGYDRAWSTRIGDGSKYALVREELGRVS